MNAPPFVLFDGLPRAVTVLPVRWRGSELLTVTAQRISSGAVVITVRGEVDWYTGPLLQRAILAQLRSSAPTLVIDLTEVGFFGATGLTVLAVGREEAVAVGTRLFVVARTRVVLLPLTITGMDRMFDIYPVLADAPIRRGDGSDG
ncbi:STAS domain-containing protein [Actinophytocola sp.]|uniref:STAS domain-containing protein n=1 Tax=Actinophytocola sp. TaxID=1872138 RepID=UPI002ED2F494